MVRAGTPALCCDMHNVHCEPPSELCCRQCTELTHPVHRRGERCVLAAPLHNLLMPHDIRYADVRGCPPHCPFRIWSESA